MQPGDMPQVSPTTVSESANVKHGLVKTKKLVPSVVHVDSHVEEVGANV